MMAMNTPLRIGDAFRGIDELHHVWFILTHPSHDGSVVIANFTSHLPGRKPACNPNCVIVQPGEHPYLSKTTCIFYQDIRTTTVNQIANGIAGEFREEAPLSSELLRRIQQGALDSDHVIEGVKAAVRHSMDAP